MISSIAMIKYCLLVAKNNCKTISLMEIVIIVIVTTINKTNNAY